MAALPTLGLPSMLSEVPSSLKVEALSNSSPGPSAPGILQGTGSPGCHRGCLSLLAVPRKARSVTASAAALASRYGDIPSAPLPPGLHDRQALQCNAIQAARESNMLLKQRRVAGCHYGACSS